MGSIITHRGGGSSRALSNLANVAINAALKPDADSTRDLGSSDMMWANLYVDAIVGPTWGTWTPSFTGFSVDPSSVTARYIQIGKLVIAFVTSGNGTSNATSFTMTLPVAARTGARQRFLIRATDNGTIGADPGLLATVSGSTTADLFRLLGGAGWTASGPKKAEFTIMYEVD